ncbi:hypothetical protein JL721_6415 [Aureococcus anophagefferens]|nr:hypothetical protein JL721_6415 [Aureococcus anophagefferens]
MAEIIVHGQVVGRAADASQFEYKPTVQVEWGHLQPGVFRYLFIPRNQLKDGDDDDSSVSSFSDSDDSEHRAEKEMKEKLKKDQEDRENADSGTRSRGLSLMSRFAHKGQARAQEIAKKGAQYFDQEEANLKEEKQKKKEEKKKREEDADETPQWAKDAGFKLLLKGLIEEDGLEMEEEPPHPAEQINHLPELIGRVIGYLNPRRIGRAVGISRAWANVGYQDPLYYCLGRSGAAVTIAFDNRIDAVLNCGDAVLASGEKVVAAFDVNSGEFLGETAIRDTTVIPKLFTACGSLWSGSHNGAIREWSLPHNLTNIEFRVQMWEHNAVINDIVSTDANPNFGGMTQEMPYICTCSDDRTVRVWNPVQHNCDAVIRPFNHHCATMRTLFVSKDHLYVGSSDGVVYVYAVDGSTRSLANRQKKRVGVEATYPLEIELSNGEEVVSAIKMSKERTRDARLYVASWDGKLRVWTVPRDDLEYELVFTLEHHGQRITEVLVSHRHFIVLRRRDDPLLRPLPRRRLRHGARAQGRVRVPRQCLSATPGDPGVMLAGLADGRVLVFEFGKIM